MINALHICETIHGGLATYLRTFDAACHGAVRSHFLVPASSLAELPASANITPYPRSIRGPMALVALTRAALQLTRQHGYDVVLCHSTFSLLVLLVLRLCGRRGAFVYVPHGWARSRYGGQAFRGFIVGMVEGQLAGLADIVLNVSHYDQALALKHGYRGRHMVVENAVCDRPLRRVIRDQAQINLLYVGRFDRQKGTDILLAAFMQAHRRNPSLHLHLVGGAMGDADQAGGHPRITSYGWLGPEAVAARFSTADVTIIPSRWEGLPMVLVESLRAGTPVIVSDVCGQSGLIGQGGMALPLDLAAFADCLAGLTKEGLHAMRPLARAQFDARFHPDRFRQETLSLLTEALACQRRPHLRAHVLHPVEHNS